MIKESLHWVEMWLKPKDIFNHPGAKVGGIKVKKFNCECFQD